MSEEKLLNATSDEAALAAAIVNYERPQNLFGASPVEVLRQSWAIAQPLKQAIVGAGLSVKIQGRDYVKVEGWTMLGSMLGVFPLVAWTRRVSETDGFEADGWEACVEAKTMAGATVGRAEGQCTRDEKAWSNRDDYALRAMAQTRAMSRAMRGPLGFVMALGGFQATAAEEMPHEEGYGA